MFNGNDMFYFFVELWHWLRLHGNVTIIQILLLHRRLNAGMQSRVRNRLITNVTIITEATVTWRYCYTKNSNH